MRLASDRCMQQDWQYGLSVAGPVRSADRRLARYSHGGRIRREKIFGFIRQIAVVDPAAASEFYLVSFWKRARSGRQLGNNHKAVYSTGGRHIGS